MLELKKARTKKLILEQMIYRIWILLLIASFPYINIAGQNTIGLPNVINFNNNDFNAGAQNWAISQDKFGILYFGNTYGLLTFNGNKWKLFPLPNKTLVRSLIIAEDGKVYSGGQDEFGYFFPSKNGTLQFHSLMNLIPDADRTFGDVWNTFIFGKDIFFRTNGRIFKIDSNQKIKIFKPASEWSYMGIVSGKLFAQDKNYGLYMYNNEEWELVTKEFNKKIVTSMLSLEKGSSLVTTLKDGVFILKERKTIRLPVDEKINQSHIYTALKIDSSFALGTTSDGVYFIDKKGATIRHLSRDSRLQNNNVISMFVDNQSNLWLGLDKGIDMVNYNSAIQKISPVLNTPAACYTARIFDGKLYIGTSDGLYFTPLTLPQNDDLSFSKGSFTRIGNSGGQVWGLYDAPGKLLMGHSEGTYQISNNTAIPVFKDEGSWLYASLPGSTKANSSIIAGTYFGLHLLKDNDGKITDSGKISGLYESLRFLQIDSLNNTTTLWSSHPYHGIYKIQLTDDNHHIKSSDLYTQKDGLPSTLGNYVYSINNRIVFCTEKGLYIYNSKTHRFEPDPQYKKIFGDMSLSVVEEDEQKNIWFVNENRLGVVLKNGIINYFPEMTGKLISGFEFIYPLNEQNIFIGSNDGLIHINVLKYQQKKPDIQLLLGKVIALGKTDSLLYNGYFTDKNKILSQQSTDNIYELPARFSSFHFEYSTTFFKQPNDVQYSVQLEGIEKSWSKWTNKNEKDYTNLPYGKYTFRVKAKDNFNHESKIVEYTFIIRPHWYQTNLAYILYALSAFLLLIFIIRQQTKKFERQTEKYEKEQAQLKYVHQLEIEHNEKEIIQLQKEKLENEVAYKNKELASTTMHLFKRGKLLSKLKEELLIAVKKIPDRESSSDFNRLIKMLKEAERQDQDWEQFSIYFDEVHNNFLKNLKQSFPDLTSSDLKVCAYLKMNLSSKEIAQLLNISLKGVEVARYRLRKKLSLSSSGINLHDFLMENS